MNKESPYFVASDNLKELKEFANRWENLNHYFGQIVDFKFVVDANVIIGDIRWLVYKRKNPDARTNLQEVIDAGITEVYVPKQIFSEVKENLADIAREENIDFDELMSEWTEYQKKLIIYEPDDEIVEKYKGGIDPDDAPFIAIAEELNLAGVVSNDPHIEKMGGKKIPVEFITSIRGYARAAAIDFNIRCSGVSLGMVGIATLKGMLSGIKALVNYIGKLPDQVKVMMIIGGIICIAHPVIRKKIVNITGNAVAGIKNQSPELMEMFGRIVSVSVKNRKLAQESLADALDHLNNKTDK